MRRGPYSSYHGRKSILRNILITIVVVLVIVLCALPAVAYVLNNYVVYTPNGPRWVWQTDQSGDQSVPSPQPDQSDVIIEFPQATSTPAPSRAPVMLPRQDAPLGLVSLEWGQRPDSGQGGIYPMTSADLSKVDLTALNAPAPGVYAVTADARLYAVAQLDVPGDSDTYPALVDRCVALAGLGFDELLFSETVPAGDGSDLAGFYRQVKEALDGAGWQGRLSLVLDQDLIGGKYSPQLTSAIAQSFERLFFRSTLRGNVNTALRSGGFQGGTTDIVTVVATPSANARFAWAVLK